MPNTVELLFIGLFCGVLAGTLGAGGGFATFSLLVAFGVDPHVAVGSSLMFIVAVGAWAATIHRRQRTARVRLGLALGLPAIVTALAGAHVGQHMSDRQLTVAFGTLTGAVAVALLVPYRSARPRSMGLRHERPALPISGAQVATVASRPPLGRRTVAVAVAGGAVVGFVQGLLGVGGGFLFVPLLIIVLKVPEHAAVGTSLMAIVIGGAAGGIRHATLGNVDWSLLATLIPAGVTGGLVGARLSRSLPPAVLRVAFVILMFGSASYLLAKGA